MAVLYSVYCQGCSESYESIIIPQNIVKPPALDEYASKMPLDIKNGSLGAEDEHFKKWDPFYSYACTSDTESVNPSTKNLH